MNENPQPELTRYGSALLGWVAAIGLCLVGVASCGGGSGEPVWAAEVPVGISVDAENVLEEPLDVTAPADDRLISQEALDLIVYFEVSGEAYYEKYLSRPICPLCPQTASGVTIGIGYDLGHVSSKQYLAEWNAHPQRDYLLPAIGLTRQQAKDMAQDLQFVYTSYGLASEVFNETTVVNYYRIAARSFGTAFVDAPDNVRGALVSLVYNRGGAMGADTPFLLDVPKYKRDSRWEMRVIRDVCLPHEDWACVARYIREMKRLWPVATMKGLHLRRDAEADLAEGPQ